jgi:hypothetical protein
VPKDFALTLLDVVATQVKNSVEAVFFLLFVPTLTGAGVWLTAVSDTSLRFSLDVCFSEDICTKINSSM